MELKSRFAEIVGTPKEGRDSWVVVEDDLFLALEITADPSFPVASKGKEMIEKITSGFQTLPEKNLAFLKKLLETINYPQEIKVALILGVKADRVFYVLCHGGGRVLVKRGRNFGLILAESGSASGAIQNGDILVFALPRFNEQVALEEIKTCFDHLTVNEIAENLTALIHRSDDTSGMAALLLEFESEERPREAVGTEETIVRPKKRPVFGIAIILVILLISSIFFGLTKRSQTQKTALFRDSYDLALKKYEQGSALAGLNNARAFELLTEAKNRLVGVRKNFSEKSAPAQKIDELLLKIEKSLTAAGQIYQVTPRVFLDLGAVKEGGGGEKMAVSGKDLIVLDKKNSAVYQINTDSKASKILAGGNDFQQSSQMAVAEKAAFVLADKGIIEINSEKGTAETVIPKDQEWGEIGGLASFGNNLYLLDKENGKIWKYTGTETGFSEKKNYLVKNLNLANASSMSIDGSVWTAAGGILKFTQGEQDNFEIKNLDKPPGKEILIFTLENINNLYVLDKANKRIVVLEKNGNYQSQYRWGNHQFSDLVVDEKEKKIYLLEKSKIYQIDIK